MNETRIVVILKELRRLAVQNGEGVFGKLDVAANDIDLILSLQNLREEHDNIKHLIAPTSNLQDLSIDCGWEDQFLELSAEVEIVLDRSA